MDYRNRRAIHSRASEALSRSGSAARQLILVFCGVTTLMSLLGLGIHYVLDLQIAETGGLGSMGLRSVLSTAQSILPIVQLIVSVCMGFSYQQNILCISRGQDADYRSLGHGFRYLGVLVRISLLEGLIYFAIGFVAIQLSSILFAFTPYAQVYYDAVAPIAESVSSLGTVPSLDEATADALIHACLPAIWIFLGVFSLLALPVFFRYRLGRLALAEDPRAGAFAALRKSRVLLRRRCLALLKLDFSLWWFYLLQALVMLVLYADLLLPIVGISLPLGEISLLFAVNLASLAAQFAVSYWTLNRVNVTYAVFYDALQQTPQPQPKPEIPKKLPFRTEF